MNIFLNIQVCVSTGLLDYRNLNILSLASVSLGTLVSFGLPKVKRTIYFHAKEETSDKEEPIEKHSSDNENKIKKALVILGYNFKTSFSQGSVFRWSLWWALGMCGNYQVCIKNYDALVSILPTLLLTTWFHEFPIPNSEPVNQARFILIGNKIGDLEFGIREAM